MLEHWLWLAHRPGLNDHKKLVLLEHLGSPENVYDGQESEYREVEGISPGGIEALFDKNLEPYTQALETCQKENIRIITIRDEQYPDRLKSIYDPPLVLYYKGTLPNFDGNPTIAIVGTRKASAYGQTVARDMGMEITRCGGLVVSGLATGIDAAAMDGAILAGGRTVGVLGCGADVVYPRSNRELFAKTEANGCILSEFLPGTDPVRWNFPRRNRIISGLSNGVVVVEAPEKSGSLITARCALDQGRDVFAVPGNIDLAGFAGSNRLLREGAGAVSSGWDVMSEYMSMFPDKIRRDVRPASGFDAPKEVPEAPKKVAQKPQIPRKQPEKTKKDIDNGASAPYIDLKTTLQGLSTEEQAIVTAIGTGERLLDEVIAECGLPSGKLISTLTMLEMKRIIVRLPGKRIALRRNF